MACSSAGLRQSVEEVARLIRKAIMEKRPVKAIYDGYERLLCPQMLGRNRAGQARVLCLQVGGHSSSGLRQDGPGDWRCLSLDKFSGVEFVAIAWQSAGDSLRRPKCIDQIEVEASDAQPGCAPQ